MPPPLATPVVAAASTAMAQRPILTDGIRPRPGREQQVSIAQEQLNEYLQRYMAEQGLALPALQTPSFADFRTNRRPGPPRAAGYVTCYKYGQGGRYSDSCMNRPLSAEYRVRAREEAERRDWNRRRSDSLPASPFSPAGSFPSTDPFPGADHRTVRDLKSKQGHRDRDRTHSHWHHASTHNPRPRSGVPTDASPAVL